jgi:hypothetical protein
VCIVHVHLLIWLVYLCADNPVAPRSVLITWSNESATAFTLAAGPDTAEVNKSVENFLKKCAQDNNKKTIEVVVKFLQALRPSGLSIRPKPDNKVPPVASILEIISAMHSSGFGYQQSRHADRDRTAWASLERKETIFPSAKGKRPYLQSELNYFGLHIWYFVQVFALSSCPELCKVPYGDSSRDVLPDDWKAHLLTNPKGLVDSILITLRLNRKTYLSGSLADNYANFMRGVVLSFSPSLETQSGDGHDLSDSQGSGSRDGR